ncbi:radical SAM protein [Clostridiaceae bacterium M8S5]|nr:radical SAM protein [Clostridiaceae bacterium M8S5]
MSEPKHSSADVKAKDLPKITSVYLTVTLDCNLACKYCFVNKENKNMNLRTAIDTVDYLAYNTKLTKTTPSITFFGGEPLLRWDDIVSPLVSYIRTKYKDKYTLSLTTNGILLDEQKLKFMKKNKVGLLFSMDGDKKTQNINRPFRNGEQTFDTLKQKLKMIKEYFPYVTFRSTTDNDNVQDIVDNFKFAVNNGFTSVFNIVNVFSDWTNEQKQELVFQINKLGDYYYELIKQGKNIVFSPFHRMFNKLRLIKEAEFKQSFRNRTDNLLANGRCGLGADSSAGVDTEGRLYSCHEMVGNKAMGDKFIIGNIYDGTDNDKRLRLAKTFNIKNIVSQDGIESCRKCKMYKICDGSCLLNNYILNDDIHIMPSILCLYYQLLLDKAQDIQDRALKDENKINFIKRNIISEI